MDNDLPDILSLRLNFDAVMYRGHSRQEMMIIGLLSVITSSLLLGLLSKYCLGFFLLGMGLSFPLSVPLGWLLAVILQKQKSDKPKGYLKQRYLLWLEKQGLYRSPFVRYSGTWQVRRRWP